jgi:OPA family glycerol-3-phosphate transporter-like MFS transporter
MKAESPPLPEHRPPVGLSEEPPLPSTDPAFHRARLRMLLAVMFCYLFYYTGRQTFGFAVPGIMQELHLNEKHLGWCGAAMLWAYAIGQAVNGQLADRFGGRLMMSLGAILSCGLNWVVSLGTGLASIAAAWTANGLAQSMGWAPGSQILSNWWDKKHRGVVYGWYVFAAGSSSVLTYLMAAEAVKYGWRWIFRVPVLFLLAAGIIFWFVGRNRPSDMGLPSLPREDGEPEAPENETAWERYRVPLKNARFMLASFAIGFQNLARYGLLMWVPVHFLGKNWKESNDAWISVALPIGMALGAVSNGWISDRFFRGARGQVITLFLLCAAIAGGGMYLLPKGHWLVVPVLFLTGFFVYGPQAGFWALCPDLLGRRHAGTGTGVMNCCANAVAGLGEVLIGTLIKNTGQTAIVFLVVAIACAVGMTLVKISRC